MVILAYLISMNPEWSGTQIRILRVIQDRSLLIDTQLELEELIESARIKAVVKAIHSHDDFSSILHQNSSDATLIFMGFDVPQDSDSVHNLQAAFNKLLQNLPTTLLVSSTGDADLLS